MAVAAKELTPQSLLEMQWPEDGTRYELSDGELIVVGRAFARHERVKSRVVTALVLWAAKHSKARVFAESMFTLGTHTARMPDVAVVLAEKLALIPDEDIAIPIAPDLAVEIISVSEFAADAERKVKQYQAADVEEVWQVYPNERLVRVRRAESVEDFEDGDTFSSRVLSGYEVVVRSFFAD